MSGIKAYQPGPELMQTPAFKIALGAATGGAGGAAMGFLGSKKPGASEAMSAIGRKQDAGSSPDPQSVIDDGIDALHHEDVLGTDIGKWAAPALMGAKHFAGPDPAIDQHYDNPDFAAYLGGGVA